MKIKPAYIYVILIAALVIFLVISSQKSVSVNPGTAGNIQDKEIPNGEVHNGLKVPESAPGKDNVSEKVKLKIEKFKDALVVDPNDTVMIREYADFLLAAHQPLNAIPLYEKILKINPKRSDAHFSLAYIYYNQGNFDKAEVETNLILSYDKNNPQALYNLGAISVAKGNVQKAREYWNDIIKKHPGTEIAELAASSLKKI